MEKIDHRIVQTAALLAIGELLDEIICHLQEIPVDENHWNFARKFLKHIEGLHKDSLNIREK